MNREVLKVRISGQLVVSTMLDITDAAFCVACGHGAGMIQLGTMLVAPENETYTPWRQRWPKSFLPWDTSAMRRVLKGAVALVRQGLGDVVVCLSLAGFEGVGEVVEAAQAFADAGGDLVELNVHGGLKPFSEQGYLAGMSLPSYRQRLIAWVEALSSLEIPLLVKFNTQVATDLFQVCRDLAHLPVFGYHFNVRDEATRAPNYAFVQAIRPLVEGVLLCSGYAWTAAAVRKLFEAGADAVGFAKPLVNDHGFIAALAAELAQGDQRS